ncbi:MAG: hypothetical protein PUC82_02790 [bacterium]|nr:hypothetical protein [bacterium]
MYLIVDNKNKIEIIELLGFWEKFKSLKFYLNRIDFGIKIHKKKFLSTAFFCQNIDIIITNADNKILYLYKNVKPEKYFFPKFKANDIYFLPLETAKNYAVGDFLVFKGK